MEQFSRINGKDLYYSFVAGSHKVLEQQKNINKINVFPVPDQDTGNNLSATLKGIKEVIENKEFNNLEEFSDAALDGALTAAQGNAGIIYTGFLAGFLPLLNKNPASAEKLAVAFSQGAERARQSIQNPKEATILDVIDAAAETIQKEAKEHQKNGNQERLLEINKQLMKEMPEMMKHSFKPMLITFIPIIVIFSLMRGIYSQTSMGGWWIAWYIGFSLVFSLALRKIFKLP